MTSRWLLDSNKMFVWLILCVYSVVDFASVGICFKIISYCSLIYFKGLFVTFEDVEN